MPPPETADALKFLGSKVCAGVASALADACDSKWELVVAEAQTDARPQAKNAASFRFSFEGSLEGEAFLCVDNESLPKLNVRLPKGETESKEALHAALSDALKECAANLEKAITGHGAVLVSIDAAESIDYGSMQSVELSANANETKSSVPFYLYIDEKLGAALKGLLAKAPASPSPSEASGANLDLVMDVDLNVTLRFGRRQLALREVFELTSGSVVELDRQVDEPVELVLDGRVVARGEAVIIDGNYGMRVTEVLHKLEPSSI